MDKAYVVNCVRSFAEKARHTLDVRQVILFGSYAKGTATDESDIDVVVIVNSPVADWLETSAELYRISGDIDLAMQPHLVDCASDRSGFLEHIKRTGELIYDREVEDSETP
ncbi:MAG: hypothetical protein A2Z18_10615 [Armatimonadetes bacterium RBG_16_58_9]|nr:MAG: hypothetical protein A2Z18_10615 [Armatimonadetes bacterium RBG_16_58_9]